MNKIYKVIWSKVKNQYVVVSELAHSNGKQSRTSRNSIRSRIAALVVCGAIAAFGVFSALPNSAYAATNDVGVAKESQYVAIFAQTSDLKPNLAETKTIGDYTYKLQKLDGTNNWYYVRDGYTIEQVEGKRFTGAQKTTQIQAIKSPNASTEGLLQSNRVLLSTPGQSTVLGDTLQKVDVGVYMGATNEGGTITPSSWNYYIQKNNGSYIDAGGANFDTYFVEAKKQADGTYTVNGKTVSSENLYVINDQIYKGTNNKGEAQYELKETDNNLKLGAFVVDGQIYTKNVFGKYNEVLMSAQQGNTYYSYWAADTYDADAPMQLTQGQYKDIVDTMWGNDAYLASSDVSKIKLEKVSEENKKGGTISLLQQGDYNSETNSYENNKTLPGAITVISEGGTGGSGVANDVDIKFSNTDEQGQEHSFTVDAGSKVEAVQTEGSDKISAIKINGEEYKFGGGSSVTGGYVDEDGNVYINQEGDTPGQGGKLIGKITVSGANGLKVTANRIDGNKGINYEVSNNLTVNSEAGEQHKNGGNWTITDSQGERPLTFTNTTLDTANSGVVADTKVQSNDKKTTYGQDYKVVDTDGNVVDIKDVASASTLKNVDIKVNNNATDIDTLQAADKLNVKYDSKDKTSVTLGKDGNKTQIHNVAAGTDDYDAVNFKQLQDVAGAEDYVKEGTINTSTGVIKLTRQLGGEITIKGLQDYVNGKDSYVTDAKLNGNTLTITQNNQGKPFNIDLSGLTSGLSSSDYQLVAPESGSYTVDNNGNLTLTVKDLNNKNAAAKTIKISGLAKKTDVAVIHDQYKDGEYTNLRDTKAQIWDETAGASDKKSSSIALGKDARVSVQNGKKADALIFGNDTYTGGIAIGENSKALNATVNIGVKDYKGKMGDVDLSDYKTYEAMGVGETSIGSNSYISGSLSTNVGSYNITTTKYMNGGNSLDSIENFGSIIVGTLNSIESNSSSSNIFDTLGGKISGVANNAIGMANKTQNSNGSLIFGTGNEITNSIDSIPSPVEISDIISDKKNDKDVTEIADSFRDAVSDRSKANGGAVLAIGGGNKADYAQNSQLIGVQNEVTGTSKDISEFNMVNGYQNTVTNGSNDTVIGTKNTVTKGDSNVVLGDNHTVKDANNNVILGSSDKETTHTASDTVVIGHNAQANGNNDVAIGSGSIANEAVGTEGYAGANPIGTVSVGSEGNERTITNVAAGRINEDSTDAVNGSQLYATNQKVDAGWTATDGTTNIAVNPTETGTTTLKFAGDRNIDVTADKASSTINVSLKDNVVLGGKASNDPRVQIGGTNGTIMATKNPNSISATTTIDGGNIYVGSSVSVGANDDVVMTDKDITGLSNTTWDGTTDNASRAATEGQLKTVSDTVNAGWTATDSNGNSIVVNPENESTLNFAGDRNIDVKANKDNKSIDVSLSDDVVLGGKEGTSRVEIGGTNGTIMATKDPNSMAATTTIDGGNVYVGSSISVGDKVEITDKDITGLSNTEWNGTTTTPDRAATEGQLQQVSNDVNAGWIATDNNGSQVNITPDNNKLNFAGDENVTVTAANNEIKVALKDDIVLGDYLNGDDGVLIGGSSGTISATNSITVGEDQGLIIDGQKKEIQGLSNTTWNEKIANDAAVEGSTAASTAATQGQLQEVSKVANAGWTASDGTNSISVKPNETLNFVGDENLTVSADGTDKELKVALKDDITLKGDSSSIELTGTKGTIQVNQETAEGTNFTNINGNVVSIGYTNSEGIENAIVIDGGKGTITGLSNTTWDDELAKQVANSEELQGTAATQGQLQQAVSAVATEAAKQHTTVSGDDNLTVTSKENTNGGTNYQVTLNDDITLGNPKAGNTKGERSFTINTTDPEGYVPDSYKEEGSSGANFIEENGGFMLFATDTQGHGIFGVTAKGSAWAKDFKTYTTDIYGNNTQYSLNDVGDAVAQMSSYYNKENGKSYTVFSRYLNEAEKDNPFATVDENATRDIPLALRDDGAVLIGATIKGDDFTDNGIRINAETETTYDGDGNEVTNNIATITGLENTEWKPPTPVATFAANDINTTSRAATEAQLDDLYSAVAAYDVNVDGTIDYSHIALAGAPYGASRAGNGTPTGGTSITNVAYASGKDGSEAVNVDYLNDAISDAAENGSISTSDQHLVANTETGSNGVYKPNDDGNVNLIVSDEKGNSSTITIGDVASKEDLDNLKDDVGDLDYSKVEGDTIIDGDSVTDAIGKLDNKIENISGTATDADNNTVTGGKINSDGTISLTQKDKDSIKLEGQLTDSGVVQEGTSFDKETGTITITSQDKYSGETSSVKVEGIASTEVVGATNKEDLATAYKDADKDGNATTEYITDSESMVEADVALDHAIQDVANTSYANDMVLSNRIDSVEKRLGNVEERIDKVGAMAAAIANLRTMGFDPEAPTEIAIGVGQYKSETGIAIGVFHYPNQDFMLSASLSSSGDELMGGIGATWKLGRKSAAERAKDEEARHLEQAEEMKKLAQQEKVKAQAQRHAKLLAERQQASQKNA